MIKKQQKKINDEKIKESIDKNDFNSIEKFTAEQIKHFSDSGLNAFLYACTCANTDTIKAIAEKMLTYFEDKKKNESNQDTLEEIDDDFCDFFYANFFDEEGKEYNAATILLIRGKQDAYDSFNYLNERLSIFNFEDKKERKLLAENFILPYGQTSYQGFINGDIKHRKTRSFKGERERQLLKQFSTILFFYLKSKLPQPKELVEVQTMHLRIGDKSILFIAANQSVITSHFQKLIPNTEKLKEILKSDIKVKGDVEGGKRIERYIKNFNKGIFGKKELYKAEKNNESQLKDLKNFNYIKNTLKNGKVGNLNFSDENNVDARSVKAFFSQNNIVFIDTSSCTGTYVTRHAEEFLIDIAEIAKQYKEEKNVTFYSCISGKKRPCITCFGRIENFRDDSKLEVKFGQYPGLIWMTPLKNQNKSAANASIKALLLIKSHVTLDGSGMLKTDYDSGTEEEDYCQFE